MSQTQQSFDADDLTPGSVWHREKKGKIITATVLTVSNMHLSEELAEKNPPQVIFIDSRNRVCTMGVDKFLNNRQFFNVNPVVEYNFTNIMVDQAEAEEQEELQDEGGIQDLDLTNPGDVVGNSETTDDSVVESEDYDPVPVRFFSSSNSAQPQVASETLAAAVISYTQRPSPATNELVHEFLVDASQLNEETLRKCFSTTAANGSPVYSAFVLNDAMYQWERFLGIYPMYSGADALFMVVLSSIANFNFTEVETAETVQVQQSQPVVAEQAPSAGEPEIQIPVQTTDANQPSADSVAAQIVQ